MSYYCPYSLSLPPPLPRYTTRVLPGGGAPWSPGERGDEERGGQPARCRCGASRSLSMPSVPVTRLARDFTQWESPKPWSARGTCSSYSADYLPSPRPFFTSCSGVPLRSLLPSQTWVSRPQPQGTPYTPSTSRCAPPLFFRLRSPTVGGNRPSLSRGEARSSSQDWRPLRAAPASPCARWWQPCCFWRVCGRLSPRLLEPVLCWPARTANGTAPVSTRARPLALNTWLSHGRAMEVWGFQGCCLGRVRTTARRCARR